MQPLPDEKYLPERQSDEYFDGKQRSLIDTWTPVQEQRSKKNDMGKRIVRTICSGLWRRSAVDTMKTNAPGLSRVFFPRNKPGVG